MYRGASLRWYTCYMLRKYSSKRWWTVPRGTKHPSSSWTKSMKMSVRSLQSMLFKWYRRNLSLSDLLQRKAVVIVMIATERTICSKTHKRPKNKELSLRLSFPMTIVLTLKGLSRSNSKHLTRASRLRTLRAKRCRITIYSSLVTIKMIQTNKSGKLSSPRRPRSLPSSPRSPRRLHSDMSQSVQFMRWL